MHPHASATILEDLQLQLGPSRVKPSAKPRHLRCRRMANGVSLVMVMSSELDELGLRRGMPAVAMSLDILDSDCGHGTVTCMHHISMKMVNTRDTREIVRHERDMNNNEGIPGHMK